MPLTVTAIKNAKSKPKMYRLSDTGNLYLLVKPNGSKLWRMDYAIHGKRKTFALGKYPAVSLAEARSKRDAAKQLISDGIDPVRNKQRLKHSLAEAEANTFGAIAEDWYSHKLQDWTYGHSRTIRSRLDRDILPWIGSIPIKEITSATVLQCLRRIEARGALETCKRCRTICSQVFCYAIASGIIELDPAAAIGGALKTHKSVKMAAITDPEQAGGLMRAIRGYQGDIITRCALSLTALTFVRPGELRHAEWKEINWIKKEWVIPAEKMKMRRDHTIPLSDQALSILREIHPLTKTGKYVFPSLRTGSRPMSGNTILAALRRMGYSKEEMTPHGFRSMASTLLHENGFNHEAIELQLAHSRKDTVSAAYDRSRLIPERKKMMQWWADYIDKLENGEEATQTNNINSFENGRLL